MGDNNDDLDEDDKTMLDSLVNLMNATQRNTIGRIKGFRRKRSMSKLNYMLRIIKDKSFRIVKGHDKLDDSSEINEG